MDGWKEHVDECDFIGGEREMIWLRSGGLASLREEDAGKKVYEREAQLDG